MDLQTISEQIKANLNQFDENEKRIIILQLLNFLKEFETENEELKTQKEKALQELESLKAEQVTETELKQRIDEILEQANEEAQRIKDQALKEGEKYLDQMQKQGRKYMVEFLDRLKDVVIELQRIDEETKTYRMHILTALRSTLYRFADNEYHLVKLDDQEVKDFIQFFKRDAELQALTDQLMERLGRFEHYLSLVQQCDAIKPQDIQQYLQNVQVIDAPDLEKTEDETEPMLPNEPVDELMVKAVRVEDVVVDSDDDHTEMPVEEEGSESNSNHSLPEMTDLFESSTDEEREDVDEETTYMKFLDIFNQYSKSDEE